MSDLSKSECTTFVALIPSDDTIKSLNKYCYDNKIFQTVDYNGEQLVEPFDFHITIYYSKTDSKLIDGIYDIDPINIEPKNIKMLGPDKNILTVECKLTKELDVLKDFYNLVYGLKSDWPNFIPHISLTYDRCETKINKLPGNLVFDKIKIVKKKKLQEEKDYPQMILETKKVVKENVLLKQYKVDKNVPSIFNRAQRLYTLDLPSELSESFLLEKFDNEKIVIFEYMSKPMRIVDGRITYYLDHQCYARKFISEMLEEAKKKRAEKSKKVTNKVNVEPSIEDIPAR